MPGQASHLDSDGETEIGSLVKRPVLRNDAKRIRDTPTAHITKKGDLSEESGRNPKKATKQRTTTNKENCKKRKTQANLEPVKSKKIKYGDDNATKENDEPPQCSHCRTKSTFKWIRSDKGLLCNACYHYPKNNAGKPRPLDVIARGERRKSDEPRICYRCKSKSSLQWMNSDQGWVCCPYQKKHGKPRPLKLIARAKSRKSDEPRICYKCKSKSSSQWMNSDQGWVCQACYHYARNHGGKTRPPEVFDRKTFKMRLIEELTTENWTNTRIHNPGNLCSVIAIYQALLGNGLGEIVTQVIDSNALLNIEPSAVKLVLGLRETIALSEQNPLIQLPKSLIEAIDERTPEFIWDQAKGEHVDVGELFVVILEALEVFCSQSGFIDGQLLFTQIFPNSGDIFKYGVVINATQGYTSLEDSVANQLDARPNTLIIQIERNNHISHGVTQFSNSKVLYQAMMSIQDEEYTLSSIIAHYPGHDVHSGHHIAYVRRNEQWYKLDDDQEPQMVTQSDVLSHSGAVVLIYNHHEKADSQAIIRPSSTLQSDTLSNIVCDRCQKPCLAVESVISPPFIRSKYTRARYGNRRFSGPLLWAFKKKKFCHGCIKALRKALTGDHISYFRTMKIAKDIIPLRSADKEPYFHTDHPKESAMINVLKTTSQGTKLECPITGFAIGNYFSIAPSEAMHIEHVHDEIRHILMNHPQFKEKFGSLPSFRGFVHPLANLLLSLFDIGILYGIDYATMAERIKDYLLFAYGKEHRYDMEVLGDIHREKLQLYVEQGQHYVAKSLQSESSEIQDGMWEASQIKHGRYHDSAMNPVQDYITTQKGEPSHLTGIRMNRPVVDHCHESGKPLGVIDAKENFQLGGISSAALQTVLGRLGDSPCLDDVLNEMEEEVPKIVNRARDYLLHGQDWIKSTLSRIEQEYGNDLDDFSRNPSKDIDLKLKLDEIPSKFNDFEEFRQYLEQKFPGFVDMYNPRLLTEDEIITHVLFKIALRKKARRTTLAGRFYRRSPNHWQRSRSGKNISAYSNIEEEEDGSESSSQGDGTESSSESSEEGGMESEEDQTDTD